MEKKEDRRLTRLNANLLHVWIDAAGHAAVFKELAAETPVKPEGLIYEKTLQAFKLSLNRSIARAQTTINQAQAEAQSLDPTDRIPADAGITLALSQLEQMQQAHDPAQRILDNPDEYLRELNPPTDGTLH